MTRLWNADRDKNRDNKNNTDNKAKGKNRDKGANDVTTRLSNSSVLLLLHLSMCVPVRVALLRHDGIIVLHPLHIRLFVSSVCLCCTQCVVWSGLVWSVMCHK